MRPLAFTGARVVDPASGHDGPMTLLVRAGRIEGRLRPDERPPEGCQHRDARGLVLVPGLVDARAHAGPCGLEALGDAAVAGGVTTVLVAPDADPARDTAAAIATALAHAGKARVAPVAALTLGLAGEAMAPLRRLREAGAVAFGQADRPLASAAMLRAVMLAARDLGTVIDLPPLEMTLSGGNASSTAWSAWLGLDPVPPEAEVLALLRDATLAAATGVALHVGAMSGVATLPHLADAKRAADVTAGVSIAHLSCNETDTGDLDPRFRFHPPLRSEDDRQALAAAIADGTLDIVHSGHRPAPRAELPFTEALPGGPTLQALLPALLRLHHSRDVPLMRLVEVVTHAPARRFGLDAGALRVGAPADLTLFDADEPWVAPAVGSAFDGARLTGRVRETWVGGRRAFALGDGRD